MIILRALEIEDRPAFEKAMESRWEEDFVFASGYSSFADQNFEKFVELNKAFSRGESLPDGLVPASLLFAFNEEGEIVGRSSVRHELNESLLKVGGHIGYGVLPEHRRQGHATEILRLSLHYIKNVVPSVEKVLVTCDEDNVASRKTIERCGGVLENVIKLEDATMKLRFWIELK